MRLDNPTRIAYGSRMKTSVIQPTTIHISLTLRERLALRHRPIIDERPTWIRRMDAGLMEAKELAR